MTAKRKRAPIRTCAACRSKTVKRDMIRVASPPSAPVALDPTGRANGRGTYICGECARAPRNLKRERFARSLKTEISEGEWRNLLTALAERSEGESEREGARTAAAPLASSS